MEVVGGLCEDSCPVDRIDCSEVEDFVDLRIGKEGFHCILYFVNIGTAAGTFILT